VLGATDRLNVDVAAASIDETAFADQVRVVEV